MPSGAIGPLRSETGALEDKVLWRVLVAIVAGEESRSDQLRAEKVGEVGAAVYGGGQRRRIELEGDKVLRPAKG